MCKADVDGYGKCFQGCAQVLVTVFFVKQSQNGRQPASSSVGYAWCIFPTTVQFSCPSERKTRKMDWASMHISHVNALLFSGLRFSFFPDCLQQSSVRRHFFFTNQTSPRNPRLRFRDSTLLFRAPNSPRLSEDRKSAKLRIFDLWWKTSTARLAAIALFFFRIAQDSMQ